MADVSVEFGAKDTGLEATLKTIQAEMSRLETEVNSGTLSFEEIAKKMREIKQSQGIFTQLGGEVKSATDSVQGLKEQMRLAETITKANRTAIEVYSDTVDELQKHLDAGTISQKTYASAIEKAEAALKSATPQTEEAKQANRELEEALKKAEQETRSLSEEQKKAEAITRSNRSATQIYNDEVSELQKHLNEGRISMETFATAVAKADAKLSAAAPQIGKDAVEMGDNVKKGSDKGGMSLGELAKSSVVAGAAFATGMAVFNAAMAGVQAVAASFGKALDLGGQLADLSAQTGVAAGELLVLQRAFDNTGAGAEKVSPAIAKMSSSIVDATSGTGAAAKAFDQLGLSAAELINLPAEQQFQKIGNALAGVANETQRSALASDVFGGKLGKDLLPLMTNFSGETRTATQQLGSMVDVMNQNSDAFDAIGDGIKVAQGKLTEFAAGLMSVMAPAIEAVVTALTRIDAAQIGKDLGSAFVGAGEAMKGFQAAVNAFQTGDISRALKIVFESAKLQAMETANSIYKNLTSAFRTAGDFIATIFAPSGALATTIVSAFEFIGNKASASIMRTLAAGFAGNVLTEGIALSLNTAANQANKTANEMEASLSGAGTRIAEQFAKAGAAMPENFAKHQEALSAGLFDTEAQAKSISDQFGITFDSAAEDSKTVDNKILNATNNSAILTNNFGKAATNAGAAQTATENAAKAAAGLEVSFAKAMGSAYTYETSTLGAQAALTRGAREMTSAQFTAGLKEVKTDLRDIGGEYKNLANSGAGIKTIAESLGLDTEGKNPKRLLLEVQQEITKIANTPIDLKFRFNKEAFEAEVVSLYDSVNTTFANPVEVNLDGDKSINAVAASASGKWETPIGLNFEATQTIQDVRDAADTNFANPIELTMSGSQAANDVFDTVNSAFGAPVTAEVDADLTQATPEVAALGDPQTFTLNADTAQAVTDISNAVGSISSQVTTQTDDNNIQSTRAELEKIATDVPMTVKADQAQIDSAVGALQAEITNNFTGGEGGPGGEGGSGGQGGFGGDGGDANADITFNTSISDPWTEAIILAQQKAREELEKIATDVPMTVKADQAQIDSAVGALQAEITNNFTGGEGGPGGEGGSGGQGGVGGDGGDANADVTSITSIIDPWTQILETIRDRLPMMALA